MGKKKIFYLLSTEGLITFLPVSYLISISNDEDNYFPSTPPENDGQFQYSDESLSSSKEDHSTNELLLTLKRKCVNNPSNWCLSGILEALHPLLQEISYRNISKQKVLDLFRPPIVEDFNVLKPLNRFISSLSDYVPRVRIDRSGAAFEVISQLLTSNHCIKLYGVFVHFLYWNIIFPFAKDLREYIRSNGTILRCQATKKEVFNPETNKIQRERKSKPSNLKSTKAMSTIEKEILFVTLEEAFLSIQKAVIIDFSMNLIVANA